MPHSVQGFIGVSWHQHLAGCMVQW